MTKSTSKKLGILLIIIMALSLLLSFPFVGGKVGEMIGVAGMKVTTIARTVFGTALGLYLISTGVAALAVPIVGIALIAIGAVLVGYSLWPYLRSTFSKAE